MKSKERFVSALRLEKTDRIPVFDFLDSQNLYEYLTGIRPVDYNIELAVECSFKLGLDAVWAPFGGIAAFTNEDNNEIYTDEWGTTYKKSDYSWPCDSPIDFPVKNKEDLLNFKIPDPNAPYRINDIKKAIDIAKGDIAVIGGICGPLTIVYLGMGYEKISMSLFDDPQLIMQFLDMATEFLIIAVRRIARENVDAIYVGEDMGFNSGPFFSPSHFRKYIFPFTKKLMAEIKRSGIPIILHSDGNLNLIIEDLIDMQINALNPIELKASMSLKDIKNKYGKKICILGGINNDILCHGSIKDVENEIKKVIDIAANNGGFIPSSDSGDVRNEMPVQNILEMFKAIKKFGSY
jgi:uroporphyrinogen decarboxylase